MDYQLYTHTHTHSLLYLALKKRPLTKVLYIPLTWNFSLEYGISRIGKDKKLLGGENEELLCNGYRVLVGCGEKVLEIDSCTTL